MFEKSWQEKFKGLELQFCCCYLLFQNSYLKMSTVETGQYEDVDNEKTTTADAKISCDPMSSPECKEAIEEACKIELEHSEIVDFKVVWNKQNFHISFDLEKKMADLREHIKELTGIPVNMQKLMCKGLIKNDQATLRQSHLCKGAKLMVIGSTLKDVLTVTPPSKGSQTESSSAAETTTAKELLCHQKEHRKILDKGKPDDVMPGIKGVKEKLPKVPLSGMYNKRAGKVRLTFKLEVDQLWLGTKERTEKLSMSSIRNVISEPIEGHEEYHMMAMQLGPTEASRYWIYWVPAQYVDAIKDTVLGRWQAF